MPTHPHGEVERAALLQGCPSKGRAGCARTTAANAPLYGCPSQPGTEATTDPSLCRRAARDPPSLGTTLQQSNSQHPHVSSRTGQSSGCHPCHISPLIHPGGVSPLVGRREGSRRTKNDGRGEVRCRVGAHVGALKRGPVELDGAGSGQGLSWRERRVGMSHELPTDPRAAQRKAL